MRASRDAGPRPGLAAPPEAAHDRVPNTLSRLAAKPPPLAQLAAGFWLDSNRE